MPIFSAKAQRFVDLAVRRLRNEGQRNLYFSWADRRDQADAMIPHDVAIVIVDALERLSIDINSQRNSPYRSDDDIPMLENDMTFISSIKKLVTQAEA